jgi:hypothetical protein
MLGESAREGNAGFGEGIRKALIEAEKRKLSENDVLPRLAPYKSYDDEGVVGWAGS